VKKEERSARPTKEENIEVVDFTEEDAQSMAVKKRPKPTSPGSSIECIDLTL
jgi:hypothetical protein